MEALIPVLMFIGFVVLIGILIKAAIAQEKKLVALLDQQYQALAEKLRLDYHAPADGFFGVKKHPSVSGNNGGMLYNLYDYKTKGKNKITYTVINLTLPDGIASNKSFNIAQEGGFHKFGKMLGMQDIQLNNADVDGKYIFKSNDELWFQSLMDDVLLKLLSEIFRDIKSNIKFYNGTITYKYQGNCRTVVDREQLERISLFMFKMGQKIIE